jgi:hypothetical protein
VRKWVPELAKMPLEYIHHPWDAPEEVLAKADVVLGVTYPTPIVSVSESRAAVDHAYGVVQRCQYLRQNPEPYLLPTMPIKVCSWSYLMQNCVPACYALCSFISGPGGFHF